MGCGWLYLILQGNWYLPTRAEDNTPLRGLTLSAADGGRKPLTPHTHHREGFWPLRPWARGTGLLLSPPVILVSKDGLAMEAHSDLGCEKIFFPLVFIRGSKHFP